MSAIEAIDDVFNGHRIDTGGKLYSNSSKSHVADRVKSKLKEKGGEGQIYGDTATIHLQDGTQCVVCGIKQKISKGLLNANMLLFEGGGLSYTVDAIIHSSDSIYISRMH